MSVNVVCEGRSDLPFLERLVNHAGAQVRDTYVKNGVSKLDKDLVNYQKAAANWDKELWLVVRDSDGKCPLALLDELLLADHSANFLLRIATPMIEEWMLADYEGAQQFFGLSQKLIKDAQSDPHPKNALLTRIDHHGKEKMRKRLVVQGGKPGQEFVNVYGEFAEVWNIDNALKNSESLRRAFNALCRALEVF